jgi:hypothetical protein
MWWRILALLGLLALLFGRARVDSYRSADVIYCPETGSFYKFVGEHGKSWEHAAEAAARESFQGRQGHLATITSQTEEEFLQRHFGNRRDLWIGASDSEEEGAWKWVTGPEAGQNFYKFRQDSAGHVDRTAVPGAYANWYDEEPNNMIDHGAYGTLPEGEDHAVWNWHIGYGWNDVNSKDLQRWPRGYLVEFSPPAIKRTTEFASKPIRLSTSANDEILNISIDELSNNAPAGEAVEQAIPPTEQPDEAAQQVAPVDADEPSQE